MGLLDLPYNCLNGLYLIQSTPKIDFLAWGYVGTWPTSARVASYPLSAGVQS